MSQVTASASMSLLTVVSIGVGVICAKPITLWGIRFVVDYKYHEGYKDGMRDYMGTGWVEHRTNISCNSQGGVVISQLNIDGATMTVTDQMLDALKSIFKCRENIGREF